jgi:hypothetical protein
MTHDRIKWIQTLADLAFPLLGYYFWHWDLYFILLFFYLDFKVFGLFSFVKSWKIDTYKGIPPRFPWVYLLTTIAVLFGSFLLILPGIHKLDPTFGVLKNTWEFLSYTEDFGIPQGIFLVPLVGYGGYMQYKMNFIQAEKYKATSKQSIWKLLLQTNWLVLAASGLFAGVSLWITLPTSVYVWSLIVGVSVYRFIFTR